MGGDLDIATGCDDSLNGITNTGVIVDDFDENGDAMLGALARREGDATGPRPLGRRDLLIGSGLRLKSLRGCRGSRIV